MNYEEMSDFEINCKVAGISLDYEDLILTPIGSSSFVQWGDGYNWYKFDPCNSWADAGPIIESNGISLKRDPADRWLSNSDVEIHYVVDKNPLRAAMIAFLMIQENKNA